MFSSSFFFFFFYLKNKKKKENIKGTVIDSFFSFRKHREHRNKNVFVKNSFQKIVLKNCFQKWIQTDPILRILFFL